MEILLRVLVVYVAVEHLMIQAEDKAYLSDIECVAESVTNGSSWACGYCLDIQQQGNKRTITGLKRDNETDCENQNGKTSNQGALLNVGPVTLPAE